METFSELGAGVYKNGDRRANPYIRSRQRRMFERRRAFRAGSGLLAMVRDGSRIIQGTLRDISDSGACVSVPSSQALPARYFQLGVPLLQAGSIGCEAAWEAPCAGNGHVFRGVRFIGLTSGEKCELRKKILLDENILLAHADEITAAVPGHELQHAVRSFFLVDVKMALEQLIEIDAEIRENATKDTFTQRSTAALDRLAMAGDALDGQLRSDALTKELKRRVRTLLGQFLYQSRVMKRAVEKPRGYPGDYAMLEMAYNNRTVSAGIGGHLDRFSLDRPYSEAIRQRKDMMRDLLGGYFNGTGCHTLRVINLASGGCRELRELFSRPNRNTAPVDLLCIDQDEEAIAFAREQIQSLDTGPVSVRFLHGNILRLGELNVGPDNSIDLIYSIGIADYLQDRMLHRLFQDSYRKLRPGGQLVVAYKDRERNKPLAFNWYVDWHFVPRNEPEFVSLIKAAMGERNISIDITREKSGVIFFATVTKQS